MGILTQSVEVKSSKYSRKDEILKKATHLFRLKGYSSSSVRDLAQQVGIEAPSIYSHFKSKEHILQKICFEMANAFMLGLAEAENESSPQKKLNRAIREHIKVVVNHNEASAVMWNEWKFLTNPSYEKFRNMKMDYENRFKSILKEGIKHGDFRKQDPGITSNLMLASLNSLAYWYNKSPKSLTELEEELTNIYLKGILK